MVPVLGPVHREDTSPRDAVPMVPMEATAHHEMKRYLSRLGVTGHDPAALCAPPVGTGRKLETAGGPGG